MSLASPDAAPLLTTPGSPKAHPAMAQASWTQTSELDQLRQLEEWAVLMDTMDKERRATFRQMLAVHTSKCCAPQHESRMLESLKDTGLDNVMQHGFANTAILSLEAVHEGQTNKTVRPLTVLIRDEPTWEMAQEKACKIALAFLLSVGGEQVRLHPNSLARGQLSVTTLRAAGQIVSRAAGPPAPGTWRDWMPGLPPAQETAAGPPRSCRGPKEANTDVVLQALLSYKKHNHIDPSHLPLFLRQLLEENLPKKGLKAFLLKHSDKFEVQAGDRKRWTFSIKTNLAVPEPPPGLEHQNTSSSSSSGWTWWRGWGDWSSWGDSGWNAEEGWKGSASSGHGGGSTGCEADVAPEVNPADLVRYGLLRPDAITVPPKPDWQHWTSWQ